MEKILKISIAAYNVEKYLEEALESLIIKKIEKLDIIIENDGSSDKTAIIAEKYEKKYPKSFRVINKDNGGYGSTINKSIKLAKGKYFKQLDGDDWYNTENLERFIEELEKIEVDIVYSPLKFVYSNFSEDKFILPLNINGIYLLEDILKITPEIFPMHSLAFRTSLLQRKNIRCLEKCFYTDIEYAVYPFIYSEKIYIYNKIIYNYRLGRDGQSVSLAGMKKNYRDGIRVLENLLKNYKYIENKNEKNLKNYYEKVIINSINFVLNSLMLLEKSKINFNLINFEIKEIKNQNLKLYIEALKKRGKLSAFVYKNFSKNYIYYNIFKFIFELKINLKTLRLKKF